MKKRDLQNKLHECLEKIESGGMTAVECMDLYQENNETLYRLLETALVFDSIALPSPTEEYKQASKNRIFYELMEEFEPERSMPVYTPTPRESYRKPLGLQPIFTIILVVVLSFGVLVGGAQAADAANPGDFLYSVDLLLEDLSLAFASSDRAKIQLRLEFANERVNEANSQFEQGHYEHANEALAAYELQMEAITDMLNQATASDIEELQSLAAEEHAANTDVLLNLLDKVPDQAQDALEHAIDVSDHTVKTDKETPPGLEDKDTPPGLEDKDKDKDTTEDQDTTDLNDADDKEDKAEDVLEAVEEAKETKDAEKEDKQATKEAEKEDIDN